MNPKRILCYIGLFFMFILSGSTNQIPDAFIDRIFVPLHGGSWSFHYAGIFVIIGIYFCFKQLNLQKESVLLQTKWRRVIAVIVFLNISLKIWDISIRIHKSFSEDLTAIYLERDQSSVLLSGEESGLMLQGEVNFKNYSNQDQQFKVEIMMPIFVQRAVGIEKVLVNKEILIPAQSTYRLMVDETVPVDPAQYEFSFGARAFEYKLFSDTDEILFKGSFDQYWFN